VNRRARCFHHWCVEAAVVRVRGGSARPIVVTLVVVVAGLVGNFARLLLLELHNLPENVEQNVLRGPLSIREILNDTEDLARLRDVVLQVVLPGGALVGELRQSQALLGEVFIKVELVQRGGLGLTRRT
jgi:hypothetical protein